jgi:HAD superfamily hydrolase (TIGR01509 family)
VETDAVQAVLFDIDGTLIDSNGAHALAWSRAVRDAGFDRPPRFFRPLIGMGGDRILPLISPELTADASPGADMARRRGEIFEAEYLRWLLPTPGARALVEHFFKRDVTCVIATSAQKKELDALLDIARIRPFFSAATTTEDAEASKPAPDIVFAALRKAGVAAERAVFIGDTPYDVEAGTAAGVRVVALRCGGWDDDGLRGAAEIYDDPSDLLGCLEGSTPAARSPRTAPRRPMT